MHIDDILLEINPEENPLAAGAPEKVPLKAEARRQAIFAGKAVPSHP